MRREARKAGAFRVDGLGKLCLEGQEVASYLFQVPHDEGQWARLEEIVNGIVERSATTPLRELPAIAKEMQHVLAAPPSVVAADQLKDRKSVV